MTKAEKNINLLHEVKDKVLEGKVTPKVGMAIAKLASVENRIAYSTFKVQLESQIPLDIPFYGKKPDNKEK